MYSGLFDVGQRMLYHAAEAMLRHGLGSLSSLNGRFRRLHDAGALQCGDFQHLTAQFPGQLSDIDFVTVFTHHVHHVDRDYHWDSQLG